MLTWQEPLECRIAEACLAAGSCLEAAQVLLAAGDRGHKAIRQMLMKICPQLIEQARVAYQAGEIPLASRLIGCAAQCGELPAGARPLDEQILAAGARPAERHGSGLACPAHPAVPTGSAPASGCVGRSAEAADAATTCARLLLRGLRGYGDVLLVLRPLVLVGTPQEPWADLPLQALLHRRHAMLVRESTGAAGVGHRLLPLTGCRVAVNGVPLGEGSGRRLADGDTIEFGSEHCCWKFCQPALAGRHGRPCDTAWLEQARPASASAVLPGGIRVRHVVLAEDEVLIGRERGTAHLVDRDLPVRQLRLTWEADGWHATVEGGVLFSGDGAEPAGSRLSLPAELALFADGPQLAGQALGGSGGAYELRLSLVGLA